MSSNDMDLLRKFQKIIKMASRVKKNDVAEALGLPDEELFVKLMDWSDQFPFKIDGDMIVVDDSAGFVNALDRQFAA
nr:hypothetical protein [Candidatus Sigynarchaeota archaeon]